MRDDGMSGFVTLKTRAPRHGKEIIAPCGHEIRVYHFAWSAIGCEGCGGFHEKNEFKIKEGK